MSQKLNDVNFHVHRELRVLERCRPWNCKVDDIFESQSTIEPIIHMTLDK